MIYSKNYECLSKDDLEQLQIERLQATLNRVYEKVSFYKNAFDKNKVNVEKIKALKDIKELPFTTKDDLRKSYPYDMFAVPLRDIIRIHSSSGTSGKPIAVGYTRNDLKNWTHLVARVLTACGISSQDFVQIAFNYSIITAGFGFHYAAEEIGASVIPSSVEDAQKQIMIMKDYKTTALLSTPSYALHIAHILKELNIHPEELSLKIGLFGAEPWSENLRNQIENQLHINAYDNYGISELIGPGVSYECEERNGLHINEDHFIVEVIDTKSLKPLPLGETGELVFTTITKEGLPLIRFRTGDISSLIEEKCKCGRTLIKMKRVSGRTDDMIIIEGANIFPSQIEEILLQIEGIEPHYQIILEREEGKDIMIIKIEVSDSIPFFDELKKLEDFKNSIRDHIYNKLGISVKVLLVEPRTIARSSGNKIKRIIDNRNI
ncbi:MAG: phenylacetate--CoA ligase [Spirochaetes bacterium]|nr:phenylacetate--CoA ligase [Spirochaetota bacterium]